MMSLSDTLTVGLVLVLLFGAVALYLYTRIQQAEQKISLLESILLDLKMSAEFHSYSDVPAEDDKQKEKDQPSTDLTEDDYQPFDDDADKAPQTDNHEDFNKSVVDHVDSDLPLHHDSEQDVEQYKSAVAEAVNTEASDAMDSSAQVVSDSRALSNKYESMTLKELQALAKTRGIVGTATMKKGPIIEALKTSDKVQTSAPLDSGFTSGTSSFLETSSAFSPN